MSSSKGKNHMKKTNSNSLQYLSVFLLVKEKYPDKIFPCKKYLFLWIGLRKQKYIEKTTTIYLYFMRKTMVSCRFSLEPIQRL
jgi:hypothetical protein